MTISTAVSPALRRVYLKNKHQLNRYYASSSIDCVQDGWRGHWRGENATEETVICDLSYIDRKYNEQFCAFGYNVVNSSPSYYFSTDLMHRLFHLPSIGLGKIGHFADDHADCVNLAKTNGTAAVYNTHSLQYFANHVYAVEVAEGGEGCIGEYDSSGIVAPTTTSAAAASGTSSAAASCRESRSPENLLSSPCH